MMRQFVTTCYVVEEEKFLLLFHPKHQKWLPPGGHLEPNETPPEAAKREVREETGLEIEFLLQENVWIEESNATSLPRPFSCLLENIPPWKNEPEHQHIDFIYIGRPVGGTLMEGKWFTLEEVHSLLPDKEIFVDTQETIQQIALELTVLSQN